MSLPGKSQDLNYKQGFVLHAVTGNWTSLSLFFVASMGLNGIDWLLIFASIAQATKWILFVAAVQLQHSPDCIMVRFAEAQLLI